MVKQLIVTIMPLLIHDAPETIQCACAILNFTILAQYVLHNNKTLRYIEHKLYGLEKTKIAFENHQLIDSKLCQPTFDYPKFHAITHFVLYIWDYDSVVNYNTTHNKAVYKYLLKAFYNKMNKEKYNSQIWKHNVRHTNIIAIKDIIIKKKARKKKGLSENIADTTTSAEVTQVWSLVDLAEEYI